MNARYALSRKRDSRRWKQNEIMTTDSGSAIV